MVSAGSMKNTLMVVLIIVTLTIVALPLAEGHTYADETVPEDYYFRILINTRKGDTIFYTVKVTEGSRIDVYYLNESEYQRYFDGDSFEPDREHIGINSVHGEFRIPDDQDYVFIVDNQDNAQKNDTRPSGDVVIDVEVVSSWVIGDESEPTLFRMIALPIIFLTLGILAMKGDTYRRRKIREKRKAELRKDIRGGPFLPSQKPAPAQKREQPEPPQPISIQETRSQWKK
jgi:hypothetical protein